MASSQSTSNIDKTSSDDKTADVGVFVMYDDDTIKWLRAVPTRKGGLKTKIKRGNRVLGVSLCHHPTKKHLLLHTGPLTCTGCCCYKQPQDKSDCLITMKIPKDAVDELLLGISCSLHDDRIDPN